MKYFLIAGEASGDIHGAQLIKSLREQDGGAQFTFLGGDLMAGAAGHGPIIHYRDMAYMGFVEVARHLGTIMGFMRTAREAIERERPDALILIDYPSFNLKMAHFAHERGIAVFYFISPKVWVWKEWRVKQIKRWVDRMFCILPFEVEFYRRHGYTVEYAGNPTVKEIGQASAGFGPFAAFATATGLSPALPLIALVPGSRRKEIADNLPVMVQAARRHTGCQLAIAGAPSIADELYRQVLEPVGVQVPVVHGRSFELVHHARVALVTSGTATLEAAILRTPQVACYRMNGKRYLYKFYRRLLKGNYVTLPNLIADEPLIPELLLHHCSVDNVDGWLTRLLADGPERERMLAGYERVARLLTNKDCTATTASGIIGWLHDHGRPRAFSSHGF